MLQLDFLEHKYLKLISPPIYNCSITGNLFSLTMSLVIGCYSSDCWEKCLISLETGRAVSFSAATVGGVFSLLP